MDPKYRGLPGIATDQPDVYETAALPESDQHIFREEQFESEHIEKTVLNPAASSQIFRGKQLEADGVDFSDRVGYRRQTGYKTEPVLYQILPSSDLEHESVEDKFRRLQSELSVLSDQIQQSKNTSKSQSDLANAITAADVMTLQSQLKHLQTEQVLGKPFLCMRKLQHQETQRQRCAGKFRKITDQLEAARKHERAGGSDKGKTATDKAVTYELHYSPDAAKFDNLSKVAAVEARLTKLETLVGQADAEKLAALSADCQAKGLTEVMQTLSNRMQMLDLNHLEMVEGRLAAVVQKLNVIKEKRQFVDSDSLAKVNEVYESMKKWDSVCEMLPSLVARLQSLKLLHEQALEFSQAMTQFDGVQQSLRKSLETDSTLLSAIESGLQKNMEVIKSNFDSFDHRLKALGK